MHRSGISDARTPSLAILATYPPPYGGVAVHVARLRPLLEEREVRYVVYNAASPAEDGDRVLSVFRSRRTWLLRYLFTAREPVIYLMSARLTAWVIGALMASWRGKKVLLRLRNSKLPEWMDSSAWRRYWAGFALRRMSGVVGVSRLLVESARQLGVPEDRLIWAPGFLPPVVKANDRDQVDGQVWRFIEKRRPLIVANGKVALRRGEDVYGLDLMVELLARLKPDYPNVALVVCFWHHLPEDQQYLDELMNRASDLGVADNVLFNTKTGTLLPVLAEADLFVRPTSTDGDANSIREALYLGVPVVASDASERPPGVGLFCSRNVDDFEAKARGALQRSGLQAPRSVGEMSMDDQARIDAYLEFLVRIIDGSAHSCEPRGTTTG